MLDEAVELDVDETNELRFRVKIEGSVSSAVVRLVLEGGEVSYMFKGASTNDLDVVKFDVPAMANRLAEGMYKGRVEVLVDNRYFSPVAFDVSFKKKLQVFAEAVKVPVVAEKKKQALTVEVAPVAAVQRSKVEARPPVVEQSETLKRWWSKKTR